jgi:hypothetical protein
MKSAFRYFSTIVFIFVLFIYFIRQWLCVFYKPREDLFSMTYVQFVKVYKINTLNTKK